MAFETGSCCVARLALNSASRGLGLQCEPPILLACHFYLPLFTSLFYACMQLQRHRSPWTWPLWLLPWLAAGVAELSAVMDCQSGWMLCWQGLAGWPASCSCTIHRHTRSCLYWLLQRCAHRPHTVACLFCFQVVLQVLVVSKTLEHMQQTGQPRLA